MYNDNGLGTYPLLMSSKLKNRLLKINWFLHFQTLAWLIKLKNNLSIIENIIRSNNKTKSVRKVNVKNAFEIIKHILRMTQKSNSQKCPHIKSNHDINSLINSPNSHCCRWRNMVFAFLRFGWNLLGLWRFKDHHIHCSSPQAFLIVNLHLFQKFVHYIWIILPLS